MLTEKLINNNKTSESKMGECIPSSDSHHNNRNNPSEVSNMCNHNSNTDNHSIRVSSQLLQVSMDITTLMPNNMLRINILRILDRNMVIQCSPSTIVIINNSHRVSLRVLFLKQCLSPSLKPKVRGGL